MTATRYRVQHRTEYTYAAPMTDGYTVAHLLLRDTPHQIVESSDVGVEPDPGERDEHVDVFGNRVLQVGVHQPHTALVVRAASTAVVHARDAPTTDATWEQVASTVAGARGDDALDVGPFRGSSPHIDLHTHGDALAAIARPSFPPSGAAVDGVRDLCHRIYTDYVFDTTSTDISSPLSDVLGARRGVCQDFAHLAAGCLRSIGLAARYVSGYIETDPPPGQERLAGADASHAWCSVWLPDDGWVDFDPTNDHVPTHRHITAAWGRDYGDVAPVRGVVIGPATQQRLDVAVDVRIVLDGVSPSGS